MWDPEHSGSGAVSEPNGENKHRSIWGGWGETEGFTHFPDKKPVERNTAISYAKALREYKPVPGTWSLVPEITGPLCTVGLCFILAIPARVFVSRDKDEFRNPPQRPAGTTKSR